jgi:hypothetical protein
MPTPSIQTLRTDAQQVLNLDSISAVRSVVAATLANANAGTPLNPNLTTQQLWNQFYQIVTQPKSDIESIIANQLMKFMYAPPAPGGAGANHEVIYNNNGVLAGDSKFLWDDALNKLDIDGSATITGDLTVDTSTLVVNSSQDRVAIGFSGNASSGRLQINQPLGSTIDGALRITDNATTSFVFNNVSSGVSGIWSSGAIAFGVGSGTFTEAMRLNASGLGVGGGPASTYKFQSTQTSTSYGGWYLAGLFTSPTATMVRLSCSTPNLVSSIANDGDGGFKILTNGTLTTVGSESLVVTPTGNVGIGVTPSAWGGSYKALQLQSVARSIAATGAGSGDLTVAFNAIYDSTDSRWEYAGTGDKAGRYSQTGSGNHRWFVSNTAGTAGNEITDFASAAMTLDASGNLLVGTTTANGRVAVDTDLAVYNGMSVKNTGTTYGASSFFFRFINSSGATAGSIQHTAVTTTNYSTTSDARLKESKGISNDTSVIDNTVVHDFIWKADGSTDRGVFAQEAHAVKPRAVSVGSDELTEDGNIKTPWSVDYSKFVPDLIVYCQQLKKQVVELTARVQTLEAK